MSIRVAINGFGRIGKMVLKAIHKKGLLGTVIDVAAVTDISNDAQYLAYQLAYDSIHRRFNADITSAKMNTASLTDDTLIVSGHAIRCIPASADPGLLPWREMGIDYVIDTTGLYTSAEKAGRHIDAGAKKVIISNNASGGGIKSIIIGVNDTEYDPHSHNIISCATCTANCIIPLIDSLMRAGIGIEKGHITILLPYTASRKVVDTYSTKGWRDGRSAAVNIIPSTVHASKSIADIFPALNGKITDTVFRVPVPEVAMVEFSLITENDTSITDIDAIFKQAAEGQLRDYLAISNDEIVSSDCIDNDHSSIYDSLLTLNSNPYKESRFFRIFSWFDNEWGYANRLVDLLKKISV